MIPQEHGHQSASYVDANMPQRYETGHIEAALTQPALALAQFCEQTSHLDRCFGHKGCDKPKEDILALSLYRYFARYQTWPTSGEL